MARFYKSDLGANAAVSTEITGYAVSTLAFLHARTQDSGYLDAAVRAARYLTDVAWNPDNWTIPFEPGSPHAYFFDIGIIARGLLYAWRSTGDSGFRNRAEDAALSLAFDFLGDGEFYPIISLPEKQPLPYQPRWSRMPGCYQLKSALAWREISDMSGDENAARMFKTALASALATHTSFLDGETDRERVMDRLHAYCYFLEALLSAAEHPEAREAFVEGLARAAALFREIAPQFERSDVSAQLLRARLIAHHLGMHPLDESAARYEAERAASFQITEGPARLRGGFWFGRKGSAMLPFANPVSTAFAVQALALWQDHVAGRWNFELRDLI